jgi:hypothetical protein
MLVQDLAILLLRRCLHVLVLSARRLLEALIHRELRMEGRSHHKDQRVVGARRVTKETLRQHGIYINTVGTISCFYGTQANKKQVTWAAQVKAIRAYRSGDGVKSRAHHQWFRV